MNLPLAPNGNDTSAAATPNPQNLPQPAWVTAASVTAGLLLLGAVVWQVYGRAVNAPFVFDDRGAIVDNPSIVRLRPLFGDAEGPGSLNAPKGFITAGRPLVNLSLAINYHFGGLNPTGYHLFSIVVHVASAMVLWGIVRRTLALDYFSGEFDRVAMPLSWTVALVWAVHPLQTDAVEYATQRTELMVGFFYLATLYASLRYFGAGTHGWRTAWLALSTLACLLGMPCKEVMVSAPLIVLLYERTFIAGSFRQAWRNSWPLYVGLLSTYGLLLALNYDGPRRVCGIRCRGPGSFLVVYAIESARDVPRADRLALAAGNPL